jgi:magnesium chelatase accessory protein
MRPLTGAPQSRLDWARDGKDWPNHAASRFVESAGLRWHVQIFGRTDAPVALLLHGTGSASHSWRDLAPMLAESFQVVAPDLPGHGFTARPASTGFSLPRMASSLGSLMRSLELSPAIIVGHSAGAAIAAHMALEGLCTPDLLVGLNGAWLPFSGPLGHWFSPAARMLASSQLAAQAMAHVANQPFVLTHLISGTGSTIDRTGRAAYAQLVASPGHVAAALEMMANWDLRGLEPALTRLPCEALLIASDGDQTVAASQSVRIARRIPSCTLHRLPRLGHLAHEEQPRLIADLILKRALAFGQSSRKPTSGD